MPELPEVETVCRGLRPHLVGRRIAKAALYRPDLRFPFPGRMKDRLEGRLIQAIDRRAKYILVRLGGDAADGADSRLWLTHLGMTGRFTVYPSAAREKPASSDRPSRHDHLQLWLDDGTGLVYSDPRRFGYMDIVAAREAATSKHLRKLGPEPLDPAFDAAALLHGLENRKTPVKSALLDQRIVAGLGNIYVCEALHRAAVSPRRQAGRIGPVRAARLVCAIRSVLEEAIEAGGSTLRDFAGARGSAGYFQHKFDVYDRQGEACLKQGCNGKIRRIVQSGRSSFYCAACQR